MSPNPPCRLFVFLARDADVGLILRRGPTRWVQIIQWDTGHDTFEEGAWFHGRIYEERCDLSPDGQLFLYFAAKHSRVFQEDEYGYAWTAISRPPWLHALALWPNPYGTYGGGGRFTDDRRVTLGTAGYEFFPHSDHPPPRQLIIEQKRWGSINLEATDSESVVPPDGADWAGRDQRGHLVFAREGKLFRRRSGKDRELIDLNDREPDLRPAPAWAQRWSRGL